MFGVVRDLIEYKNNFKYYLTMKTNIALLIVIISILILPSTSSGRARYDISKPSHSVGKTAADEPYVTIAVHKIGRIGMTISNQGHFGKGFAQGSSDPMGGEAPSCTYPYPGQQSYLFAGAFWIGAVVGRDTLVSVGADGWSGTKELWPDPEPRGRIEYRSLLSNDPEAISEQDFIAIYTDTVTNPQHVDIDSRDGRPHIPLGIEVTQRSYAWSYAYAEDFILFDYSIKNISHKTLEKVYMGFYVDGDVQMGESGEGYDDDICGFKLDLPSSQGCGFVDTINLAYIADNDGRDMDSPCPYSTAAVTGVTGIRVIRTPSDSLKYAFNWWISNGAAPMDFGPRMVGTLDDPFRDFGGFLGTPEGDKNKYYIMRHAEFDYDELFCAVDHTADGWLPPDDQAYNFADGFDTRYLLSCGPFDIDPGEVLPISFAYIGGENFHTDCRAFENLFNANDPYPFYNQLNFEDFGVNSMWASWLYDNPGVDTDGDGYYGKYRICGYDSTYAYDTVAFDPAVVETTVVYLEADTVFYEGDRVPDFRGAAPPPAPEMWVLAENGDTLRSRVYPRVDEFAQGELRIRWNGFRSETEKDVFSDIVDFEGYRVYMSLSPMASDFYTIASFDIEDFNKFIWNDRRRVWELKDPPYSLDSLRLLYGDGLDPNRFDIDHHFYWGDSVFYFAKQDWNADDLSDPLGIHKVYPDEPPPTTLLLDTARIYYPEELTEDGLFKYFEYEFIVQHLLPSRQYYLSVTAFDYGSPASGLSSLETPPHKNYVAEYALNENSSVFDNGLNVIVYPNPYRTDGNYADYGFEGRDYIDSVFSGTLIPQVGLTDERTRSIHFINLPHKCTIRIFSLDGDIIREIEHDYPPDSPRSMHERWDLISRNTQMVVSGIYYWSVESEYGSQIGKLVVIM